MQSLPRFPFYPEYRATEPCPMIKPTKADGLEMHYPERVPFALIDIPLPVVL